jgi:hypothetical protein
MIKLSASLAANPAIRPASTSPIEEGKVKFLKAFLFGFGLYWALSAAPAQAQSPCGVNFTPQPGINCANIRQATYSAASIGLVPAASATDVFCISGSSTKQISIRRITISGTAGTLVTLPFTLLRRASLDTGGTPATNAALPVASSHLSTNAAATATLVAYTANPTIVDSAPLYFKSDTLSLNTTAALVAAPRILWEAGTAVDAYSQGFDIPSGSTTQQYCVNLNAVSVTSGVLNISITWVES